MASSSLRRWPTAATPISLRSSAVSLGRTSASISLSRNACSYRPKPSPRSQAPTSTPSPVRARSPPRAQSIPSRAGPTRPTGRPAVAEGALVLSGSPSIAGKAVRLAFDGGRLTSNAGVLLLADIERRLGIAEHLARCLTDPRSPERVHYTLAEMIRFRVLLIAAGYPDANDCDALRTDPAFKMAVGRSPESGRACAPSRPCAGSRTCPATALKRMMAAMVELFCDSFAEVPHRIVLDVDDTEDRVSRRPGARALPRPLRRALLPADPRLRGDHGQAGGGDPAPRQDPGRGQSDPRPAARDPGHPPALAEGRHPGPGRRPLRPAAERHRSPCAPRRSHIAHKHRRRNATV